MTDEHAEKIHRASLALLDDPGVRIEHDAIYDALMRAGAKPGVDAQVVRFPEELVMDCIAQAPSEVFFADRKGGGHTVTPDGDCWVWSVPGLSFDRRGDHQLMTRADLSDLAHVLDQLDEVDGVFGGALADAPVGTGDVIGLRLLANETQKHIRVLSFTPEGADALCAMRPVVDDLPWFSVGFTAHGPLRWTQLALDIFARTAGHGIPCTVNGEPMAGVSGPTTLAGAAAVGNAEILAGLVVNQVLEPGRPCVYNLGLAHVLDMKTTIAVTGAPENHLLADVSAAMGRFYKLPACSWVSTESMCVDGQAALEKSIGFFTHLQSGVGLVWGVGQLESEMTLSPAQAVIDNEILRYVRRYLRGIEVTDETLAVDLTREVGISGSFLDTDHTLMHFRSEFFEPSILFRKRRPDWVEAGQKTLRDAAEDCADRLIANERVPHLTSEQDAALAEIETAFLECMR